MDVYRFCFILLLLKSQVFGASENAPLSLQLSWGSGNSHNCVCNQHPEDQISWVDYNGKVPPDAIIAGKKQNGSYLYIGQVYHFRDGRGVGLATVEIFEGEVVVYVADNYNIYPQDITIKILTGASDYIEWADTNIDMPINKITDNILVRGGHQPFYGKIYEYIGRIKKDGDIFIGRAIC